jgi:light-regulated signal transduction histidine kinase (bacteriophytochrome)
MTPMTAASHSSAEKEALMRRLAESEREMGAMLYAISHDVRAPLRALDGFALALEEDYAERLDETGRDYLVRIRTGAKRMDRMIDSVVRLSRLQSKPLVSEHADFSHMANDILSGLLASDGARVVKTWVDPRLELTTDRMVLRIALNELLSNAWNFTAKTPGASIEVRGEPGPNGSFAFSIRDNGAGFDVARAGERLFGLFQRFHAPGEFPGEGAGLALARRAVLMLGGTLSVESKPGEGAVFHCTISNPIHR